MLPVVALLASVDFVREIAPLLEKHCISCHGPAKALGGLRVDSGDAIRRAIAPGRPERSALFVRTAVPAGKPGGMPPGGPPISTAESAALRAWIAEGAVWPANARVNPPAPGRRDTVELSAKIHAAILNAAASAPSVEFKAYRHTIPGTDVSYEMAAIPGGEFTMGTPDHEPDRRKDEGPQRKVKIEPFWMGKFEVTWNEYRLFMFHKEGTGENVDAVSRPTRPYVEMSFGMGIDGFPAISMTHHAANKYAEWLSARTGHFYRLPTEAEWEYACRAGSTEAWPFGGDAAQLDAYAWYAGNSNGKYQKAGTRKPNPWGLYDMYGNVMEWTLDQYLPDAYARPFEAAWVKSAKPYPHAVRGGSWNDDASQCRCGARVGSDPSWKMQDPQLPKSIWYHTDAQWLGFRVVRPVRVPSAAEMHAAWNNGVEVE